MLKGAVGSLPLLAFAVDSSLMLVIAEDSGRESTRYHVKMSALFVELKRKRRS